MTTYLNLGGNSNIYGYTLYFDGIDITFNDGSTYRYNCSVTGTANIETLKSLALQGKGLNAFIQTRVRKMYAMKIR